jgi:hypothetical protein
MVFQRRTRSVRSRRARGRAYPFYQLCALEGRTLLSTAAAEIAVDSASTSNSRSVTFQYDVTGANLGQPLVFGIYRSATDGFDSSAVEVASVTLQPPVSGAPTLDASGQPATNPGHHELTVAIPGGLSLNPEHPYVVVVADPAHALSGVSENPDTASFRTYTIGVVTHGGIQPKSWDRGVPWALRMAGSLRAEGYDAVIPFNWVPESKNPGSAAKEGPRLAQAVLHAASQFPADAPVNVHFIGHSEGAVVNGQAILALGRHGTPQLESGYLEETMLDPHAANSHALGGKQYSVSSSFLGSIAKWMIDRYQSKAKDPLPIVPANVDAAEVFFQHTTISHATGSNHGIYNLWGQVPVRVQGDVPVKYYNLTGMGISHGGDYSVPDWYQVHVVPTLADGSPFVNPGVLTGGPEAGSSTSSGQAAYQGDSAPGARIRVFASSAGSTKSYLLGTALADSAGSWNVTTRPLPHGTYRVIAKAVAVADPSWPHVLVTSRAPLGRMAVAG